MDQAVADLTEYADGVGMFFDRTTDGALDADAVKESINGLIQTLAAAVDSLAAGDPQAFADLKAAADHMVMGAATMAEGLSEAAAGVVDDNAVALADAVGGLAGNEQRDPFLDLWCDHIGYFVDYAGAVAEGDDDSADSALMALDAYRSDAGEFFGDIPSGELPAEDAEEGLSMHVQTVAGAIDSLNEALVQN
ncbi:hypothetical protein [Nesterenkonia natronophila]|uniref:Uncharacterized protein n=1 Tax=Nesterenkonia natronophila TaxID=2174932 RepID=A0A3A4F2B4_9MICC|nr:hypothetical protein [Nesterenkonia natronophila]RJN31978.1 hypothetical protein D3250_07705 [Nesterenkonia natronophila]